MGSHSGYSDIHQAKIEAATPPVASSLDPRKRLASVLFGGGQLVERVVERSADVADGSVFVSYATADRKQALAVCNAVERRGIKCWISTRDVAPGENYQEAIVQALRSARAMILIFSSAANESDEIKKELSLASRYRIRVIALRIEDVEPADAFAYELSTRQWIDLFSGREKALTILVGRIAALNPPAPEQKPVPPSAKPHNRIGHKPILAGAALVAILVAAMSWFLLRPSPAPTHSIIVRLDGFQLLSSDLPTAMPQMVREEVIRAFGDDGVIRVSTAPKAGAGSGPAYLLGGTIRRQGDVIRVITRLTNERSGVSLWTDTFDYDAKDVGRIPRRIAVDAGNMVHCGLFAASTYRKALPDAVMSDYMQFCQNSWWSQQFSNPQKALDAARKVVAAAPDFSWGWSAITVAAQLSFYNDPGPHREELRRIGIEAADKALAIDKTNSEAFAQKSMLIGRLKWADQEGLLTEAIGARPLFCGCEHYLYGVMLANVGRYTDAVRQMRRSTELLALDGISQFGLADALLVTGDANEARPHFEAAVDLFRDPSAEPYYTVRNAPETGDYAAGIKALADPRLDMANAKRRAVLTAFNSLSGRGSRESHCRSIADRSSRTEPGDSLVVRLLGLLGAHKQALLIIESKALQEDFSAASWLWYPSMRETLKDPAAARVVERIGLLKYWRSSRTEPDVCAEVSAPRFCSELQGITRP